MQSTKERPPLERPWLPPAAAARIAELRAIGAGMTPGDRALRIEALVAENAEIHDQDCINLNPAANVMNPRAEALLAAGLGPRPSLGYPGAKYETGLEAIEEIEVIADGLARAVFGATAAELRAPSGAMANLMVFMALCRPGDAIIVPPAAIGGHVTHHAPGAAGLYGLEIHEAPVDAARYTVDVPALEALVREVRPRLITLGGSLNLTHHPVAAVADIAHQAGARLMFDAAHLSGPIAGGLWPNPLAEGADVMTMSTYKSLAGPPGGLIVTGDAEIAERVERVAFPGLTANFDAGRVAALAMTLADWQVAGSAYAAEMLVTAQRLARALADEGLPVVLGGETHAHQTALDAAQWGGGGRMAAHLRAANLLASGIGLPHAPADGGLRLGVNEIVRRGMTAADAPELAALIADALRGKPEIVARRVSEFRARFRAVRYTI